MLQICEYGQLQVCQYKDVKYIDTNLINNIAINIHVEYKTGELTRISIFCYMVFYKKNYRQLAAKSISTLFLIYKNITVGD